MTTPEPVIEINKVNFSINGKTILRNVNLTINQLESICVVGPNGGGKSTLIKLVMGLLMPDSGSIRLLGNPPQETRSRVGYVPQYANFDLWIPFFQGIQISKSVSDFLLCIISDRAGIEQNKLGLFLF